MRSCPEAGSDYGSRMALTSVYLTEEALSLPPRQRAELAKLLMESLTGDGRSDEEIRHMLDTRLADLKAGRDAGSAFEEVFGEKA